ncbi:MAG: AAA family ATPase [Myxococcales bacterium]|jgi:2-phosphoglycerate kinase|nr:AAA family ATPase [Myxococcales bacterium]
MIVLIGGAPGVGKSAVAYQLARELALLRLIDLDVLRDMLRIQSREKDDPILFCNALNAWELHGPFGEKSVHEGFHAHMRPIVGAAFSLIDSYLSAGKSAIFHGVGLLPSQMARYQRRNVHQVVVATVDEESYRTRLIEKYRMRTGMDPLKVRIDAGWMLHRQIVAEAEACGLLVIAESAPAQAVAKLMHRIRS